MELFILGFAVVKYGNWEVDIQWRHLVAKDNTRFGILLWQLFGYSVVAACCLALYTRDMGSTGNRGYSSAFYCLYTDGLKNWEKNWIRDAHKMRFST